MSLAAIAVLGANPAFAQTNRGPTVTDLVTLLVGEYDSRRQQAEDLDNDVPEDQRHAWVDRTFALVDAPAVGNPVMITTTSYNIPPWYFDNAEFMVWTFSVHDDTVVMSPRRFKDFDRRLPYASDPEKLAGFTDDDLEAAVGGAACDIVWRRTDDGFSGRSEPCRVMSVTKNKMMSWRWEFELGEDALRIAFTGTDDDGAVLDCTPVGKPYRLDRR